MRIRAVLGAAICGVGVVLTGCGSGGDGDGGAADGPTAGDLSATGEFGEAPELTVPDGDPPVELTVELLADGDGTEVLAGDLLVVDYLGQTWDPRHPDDIPEETRPSDAGNEPVPFVFDSSYERGEPAVFEIGVGGLIPGWDDALVGEQVGSRLLLTVPPDQGYGGQEEHDLAEDTLVFVVDLIGAYNTGSNISGEPVNGLAADLPQVTDDDSAEPTVEFPAAAVPVSESTSDLLMAGDGPDLADNLVVKALEVSYTTGEQGYSSWDDGRVSVIGLDQIPGLRDALDGQKVGSRALARIAAAENVTEDNPDGEPIAIVIDVIGTF